MKVKAKSNFYNVFGADSFIQHWPEILTTGIEIKKDSSFYYVVVDGKIAHDSAFFSEEEFEQCLEVLSE